VSPLCSENRWDDLLVIAIAEEGIQMKKHIVCFWTIILTILVGVNVGFCLTDNEIKYAIDTNRIMAKCSGSDVNLRTEPSLSSEVITMLKQGEPVYAIEWVDGEEWPWLQVITREGQKGWMYGQYFKADDDALSKTALWKANFESRIFFTLEGISNSVGQMGERQPLTPEDKKYVTGYCDGKRICGHLTVYVYDNGQEIFTSAKVETNGYDVGGVRIGDSINKPEVQQFGKMLKITEGWEEGPDFIKDGENRWYYKTTVDNHRRPSKCICVTGENGKIKSIWWCIYLVD
jgi:hypothetical protein